MFFQDIPINIVDEHKHLGLLLDKELSFSSNIKEILIRAGKGIGIIRSISRYMPRTTLDQTYKLHVRSHFEYCDVIYHTPPTQDPFTLSNSQNYLMSHLEMQCNILLN